MIFEPHTELEKSFGDFGALIGAWGIEKLDEPAIADSSKVLNWGELAALTARIAARLTGASKNTLYARALELGQEPGLEDTKPL